MIAPAKKHMNDAHGIKVVDEDEEDNTEHGKSDMQPAGSESADQDCFFNYASTFLMSLLKANFNDTVKEMDGQRLLRCWKLVMLCYKIVGRTEYALESFYLQDQ